MSTVQQTGDALFSTEVRALRFTVLGDAQPAGSKRAFTHPGTGRPIIVDANKKSKPWQAEVKAAAVLGLPVGFQLIRGPVVLTLTFYRVRPKGHYGSGRNAGIVKANAPIAPTTRPDALKLARGVEDSLSGLVYADDSQIVDEHLFKRYGEPARCEVEILYV